jgi:hypothetical protein
LGGLPLTHSAKLQTALARERSVAGYHYEQITGDSGSGATLGDFRGRVTALGPNVNYSFQLHKIPVATSLRWYHEFNTKNRLEGDSIFLTATIPLSPRPR